MKTIFFTLIFFSFFLSGAFALSIVTEDYPPFNYKDAKGKITGMATDVVLESLKEAGMKSEIKILPWARAYKMAQEKKDVLIYSIGRNKKRENLFKWVGKIAPYKVYFFKLKKRKDIKVSKLADAKKYKIGGLIDDARVQFFMGKGFDKAKIQLVANDDMNVRKLVKGRIDLIAEDDATLLYRLKKLKVDINLFEKMMLIKEVSDDSYMAFSKKTDDLLVERLRKGLGKIKKNGVFQKIMDRYTFK